MLYSRKLVLVNRPSVLPTLPRTLHNNYYLALHSIEGWRGRGDGGSQSIKLLPSVSEIKSKSSVYIVLPKVSGCVDIPDAPIAPLSGVMDETATFEMDSQSISLYGNRPDRGIQVRIAR